MIVQEVFMDILALHRQGCSYRAIARKLSIHRNTVKKYVEGKRNPVYSRARYVEFVERCTFEAFLDTAVS